MLPFQVVDGDQSDCIERDDDDKIVPTANDNSAASPATSINVDTHLTLVSDRKYPRDYYSFLAIHGPMETIKKEDRFLSFWIASFHFSDSFPYAITVECYGSETRDNWRERQSRLGR
jgi:hypothetical protein